MCVWELHKPAQCLLPSLSLTLYCPLSLSFIFILFAAQRPYRSSTRLSAVILSALTRRVLPDAHLEMGEGCISDSSEMHLRMLVLLWVAAFVGDMAPASIRIEAVFLLIQMCSLMSNQCDSKDNLQHYFLHTLFLVMPCCQTSICFQSSCDRLTFPNSSSCCLFYFTHIGVKLCSYLAIFR